MRRTRPTTTARQPLLLRFAGNPDARIGLVWTWSCLRSELWFCSWVEAWPHGLWVVSQSPIGPAAQGYFGGPKLSNGTPGKPRAAVLTQNQQEVHGAAPAPRRTEVIFVNFRDYRPELTVFHGGMPLSADFMATSSCACCARTRDTFPNVPVTRNPPFARSR